eukprot:Rhum_TRINITY_DN13885_c3_g1::Rhum_TRINITY_DN13885_c3_g1_i1::g.65417::m.65417
MFSVLVASDFGGTTQNFEITFPGAPTQDEIRRQADLIYRDRHGGGFAVASLKIYDRKGWVDLASTSQLTNNCQLFAVPAAPHPSATHALARPTVREVAPPPLTSPLSSAAAALPSPPPPILTSTVVAAASPPPPAPTSPTHGAVRVTAHSAHASSAAAASSVSVTAGGGAGGGATSGAWRPPRQSPLPSGSPPRGTLTGAGAGVGAGIGVGVGSSGRPAAGGGARSTSAAAAAAAEGFVEAKTFEDKVSALFKEFDQNGNRTLEPAELQNAFRLVEGDFNAATISDLIAKIDRRGSRAVTPGEWERFCQRYPTLVDSFYCRVRACWETAARDDALEAARALARALRADLERARAALEEAQRAHAAAKRRLAEADAAVAQARADQRAAEEDVRAARADADALRLEHTALQSTLQGRRQKEEHAARAAEDCAQHAAHHQRLYDTARRCLDDAEAAEASAAAALAQASGDAARLAAEVAASRRLVEECKARERAAAAELSGSAGEVAAAAELLARVEMDVAVLQEREGELREALGRAMDATKGAAGVRDGEYAGFRSLKEAEHTALTAVRMCAADADEVAQRLAFLEAEHAAFLAKRAEVEGQERPLLEQELRLRAQRCFLEQEEGRLRMSEAASAGAGAAASAA